MNVLCGSLRLVYDYRRSYIILNVVYYGLAVAAVYEAVVGVLLMPRLA